MNVTDKFLQRRKGGIGGSDVASIVLPKLGKKAYSTPLEVYNDKITKEVKEKQLRPDDETSRMFWGKLLEKTILEQYEWVLKNSGHEASLIHFTDEQPPFKHKKHNWLLANIDGLANVDGEFIIVDAKFVSSDYQKEWGAPGTDEVPYSYNLQLQHYMYVLNVERAHVAALLYGKLVVYEVNRDRELYDKSILPILKKFWFENVIARVQPEPVTFSETKQVYVPNGDTVEVNEEIEDVLNEIKKAQEVQKDQKELIEQKKMEIAKFMKNSEFLVNCEGEKIVTNSLDKNGKSRFTIRSAA